MTLSLSLLLLLMQSSLILGASNSHGAATCCSNVSISVNTQSGSACCQVTGRQQIEQCSPGFDPWSLPLHISLQLIAVPLLQGAACSLLYCLHKASAQSKAVRSIVHTCCSLLQDAAQTIDDVIPFFLLLQTLTFRSDCARFEMPFDLIVSTVQCYFSCRMIAGPSCIFRLVTFIVTFYAIQLCRFHSSSRVRCIHAVRCMLLLLLPLPPAFKLIDRQVCSRKKQYMEGLL